MCIRENLKLLADLGMKVGKDRISRLLNLARSQQAQQQAKPEQPSQDPCGYTNTTANEWSGRFWSRYTSPFGI